MNDREDAEALSLPFARRLLQMAGSKLLTSRHLAPWADREIGRLDRPPVWVLDVAVATHQGNLVAAIQRYAHSDPPEPLPPEISEGDEDDHVASLFLRYARRELSWATFLDEAGRYTDMVGGRTTCEYFYYMLNDFEAAEFDAVLEQRQRARVEVEFGTAIESVRWTLEKIRRLASERPSAT